MELSAVLLPVLREHFASRDLQELPGNPFARFPCANPRVGKMELHDDGGEVTITIGDLFTTHFGCFDPSVGLDAQPAFIAEAVREYLADVFADRVQFTVPLEVVVRKYRGKRRTTRIVADPIPFVWSGPVGGMAPN